MMSHHLPTWLIEQREQQNEVIIPAWLSDSRAQAWDAFRAQGLPTKQNERFKHTDLQFLNERKIAEPTRCANQGIKNLLNAKQLKIADYFAVLLNGELNFKLSKLPKATDDIIICSIKEAILTHGELIKTELAHKKNIEHYPFASANQALFGDGLFVYLTANQPKVTLQIISLTTNNATHIHAKHLVLLEQHAQLQLIHEYVSHEAEDYFNNDVLTLFLQEQAQCTYYKLQHEHKSATHLTHLFVEQEAHSLMQATTVAHGGQFARDDIAVALRGAHATFKANGFYHLSHQQQYLDHHIDVEHVAAHTESQMLYKGVLKEKSCAVFNGRVHVNKTAQLTRSFQANHHLILNKTAEVYAKPELEIYADNVQCKHGATSGQLDEEALFYLCARGIDRESAIHLLLKGFAFEIINQIDLPEVKASALEGLNFYAD